MAFCFISEEDVAVAIQIKDAGPTGVVSEMLKASGGFGTRWRTNLINNIVKESCIPDVWRKKKEKEIELNGTSMHSFRRLNQCQSNIVIIHF